MQCRKNWGVGMQAHPIANLFGAKLVRFGQMSLDFGKSDKIWTNLIRFWQN